MVKMQVYYMEVGMCLTSYNGINTSICLYLFERIFCLKSPIELFQCVFWRNQIMGLDLSQHDETCFHSSALIKTLLDAFC
jgi:hypothetical protein